MCTRVLWPDANDSVLVGRSMDFRMDLLTNLWKMPRGMDRSDGVDGTLTWQSKYGSIIATAFDVMATDGMNEAGFAGHLLWLAESDYGNPTPTEIQLSQAVWLQYYLDNFATVAEAVEWTRQTDVRIAQLFDPTGNIVPTLHLALDDASGDSAIIEYTNGTPTIYHSRDYLVMTNSPTYDKQLELVTRFEGLGGDEPLPGSTVATARFARASYYIDRQGQPASQVGAIAAMLSIIHNVAQPFRLPDHGAPEASQTLWQVVADLTNRRYVFESTSRPNIVWVDFDKMSFGKSSKVLKLNLVGQLALEGGLAGDVSSRFRDPGERTLRLVNAGKEALEFVAKRQSEFAELTALLREKRQARA